jgi:23S rRNA (uracil1939-C5)-methyltransferase
VTLAVGSRVELEVESLAAGGDGVGRFDGCVIFVPYTCPGDRLLAELVQVRRRYARGRLIHLHSAGPGRRDPPCPYFGCCGGCSWLHLDDDAQSEAREIILRDALTRIAALRELPPIEHVRSPRTFGYRSRARLGYADGHVGLRAAGSHQLVAIDRCLVLDEQTHREFELLRRNPPRGRGEVEIRGYEKEIEIADHRLQVSPGSFFQVNRSLWEAWVSAVIATCGTGELAVELYAGVGFFTFGLERNFTRVIAVERGSAASDLLRNSGALVFKADAASWLPQQVGRLTPDLLLLNPPRTGCDARVMHALRVLEPARVVYLSCEPTTLARDLARLGPRFRLTKLLLLEALPQTHHVEALAVLAHIDIHGSTSLESSALGGEQRGQDSH